MIGVSSSGASFRGLAAYLRLGRSGQDAGRVDWTAERNLPTNDIALVGKVMRETAAQNRRVREPLYHFVLSFDRRDAVAREHMERVVDLVLAAQNLTEHQALLVAHRDRAHAHVHVMVNRIHPETHRAWDRWHDMVTMQLVLRAAERTLGLRVTPGRLADDHPPPDRLRPRVNERASLVREHATAPSTRESLLARAREHLSAWRGATSWSDLAERLEAVGLSIEARARGAIITDGDHYIRASCVAPDCSGRALAERFGEPLPPLPPQALDKAQEVASAIRQFGSIQAASRESFDAGSWVAGARHRRELLDAAYTRADAAWHDFDRALARLFPQGAVAVRVRAEFTQIATHESVRAAGEALVRQADGAARAERGGRQLLPLVPRAHRAGFDERVGAGIQAGTAALKAEHDLETLAVDLRRTRLTRERTGISRRTGPATVAPSDAALQADMRHAFTTLYVDADRALHRFGAVQAARGGEHAVRVLAREPEQIGRVRGISGLGDPSAAPSRAATVAQRYVEATGVTSERDLAHEEAERAERAVKRAAARQRELPERSTARTALQRMAGRLRSAELAALNPLLAMPERAILRTVRQAAREIALGRSSEVER